MCWRWQFEGQQDDNEEGVLVTLHCTNQQLVQEPHFEVGKTILILGWMWMWATPCVLGDDGVYGGQGRYVQINMVEPS